MKNLFMKCLAVPAAVAMLLVVLAAAVVNAQEQPSFASAEEAVNALVAALENNDVAALGTLLGPGSEGVLSSGDEVADANARADFLARYQAKHALVAEDDGAMTLQVGDNDWPLPIPVVLREGKWYLDGAAGADEIVYRRVGRNELGAIAVSRGFVDAQIEYAAAGHDGNEPGVFAAKLMSDPEQQNGLYWPTAEGAPPSPAGETIARAAAEGYRAVTGKRRSYHGYYYRILRTQGPAAPGGKASYMDDQGLMTRGFAVIAWPAKYGNSGVMTFLVNQQGIVFQKDLGAETDARARDIIRFEFDTSWEPTADTVTDDEVAPE